MAAATRADADHNYPLAEQMCLQVVRLRPNDEPARLLRAVAVARQGRKVEALRQLDELIKIQPRSADGWNLKSKLLRESGRIADALSCSNKAFQIEPQSADIAYNLGLCLFGLGRHREAIDALRHSLLVEPGFHQSHYALACVYESMGQPWQAFISANKNVEQFPFPDGFLKLGQLALALDDLVTAIDCGTKAKERPGLMGRANLLLAEAWSDLDPEKSELHLQEALQVDPSLLKQHRASRSKRFARLGRFEEARAIYEEDLKTTAEPGSTFLNWVTVGRITDRDRPLITQMESILGQSGIELSEQIYGQFALGKCYDNLGDYERAIRHYDAGNALHLKDNPAIANFSQERFRNRIDGLINLFSREFFKHNTLSLPEGKKPIFIVGMMRSGTTLVEQILCRHSFVKAGGELAHWTLEEHKIVDLKSASISQERVLESRARYAEILQVIGKGAPYVTDKNPANCFALGQIALAFPQAKIVQVDRSPVETALSIYITPMRNPPEFGCVRENIRFAILETLRLRDHWQKVLPPDILSTVNYESLVTEQEKASRSLIAGCNLEWEDTCLAPEDSKAIVGTPSLWQVRQPVNASSLNRSKRYEPWLKEFADLT